MSILCYNKQMQNYSLLESRLQQGKDTLAQNEISYIQSEEAQSTAKNKQ